MQTSKNILAWQILHLLQEGQGFRGASLKLGIDFAVASRMIQNLEAELGISLIERGVRPSRLSDIGHYLLPAAEKIIQGYEEVQQRSLSFGATNMTIRFGVPVNVPRESIAEFTRLYALKDPALHVEIMSDLTHRDILEGRAQAAFLPYRPHDKRLHYWDIGRSFNVLMASVDYVRRHGAPQTPEDLVHHAVILRSSEFYPVTKVLQRGQEIKPFVYGKIAFAGDVLSGKEALLRGEGIAISLSMTSCWHELETGKLVPVLLGWHRPEWEMTLITDKKLLGNRRLINFLRAFAESESIAVAKRRQRNVELLKRIMPSC